MVIPSIPYTELQVETVYFLCLQCVCVTGIVRTAYQLLLVETTLLQMEAVQMEVDLTGVSECMVR